MPTYSYRCKECSHQFEVFQKITEEPIKRCPKCQKETAERGIGGGSALFQFQGSGFYITDYKEKEEKKKDQS